MKLSRFYPIRSSVRPRIFRGVGKFALVFITGIHSPCPASDRDPGVGDAFHMAVMERHIDNAVVTGGQRLIIGCRGGIPAAGKPVADSGIDIRHLRSQRWLPDGAEPGEFHRRRCPGDPGIRPGGIGVGVDTIIGEESCGGMLRRRGVVMFFSGTAPRLVLLPHIGILEYPVTHFMQGLTPIFAPGIYDISRQQHFLEIVAVTAHGLVHLPDIADALHFFGGVAGFPQRRQQQRCQNGYDRDHYKELYQRKMPISPE